MAEAPFTLARATEADVDEIVDLQYDCFPDWIRRIFMGCHSRDDLPRYKEGHVERLRTDPNDAWVKVTDKKSGKIIAASNWKVYVNGKTGGGVQERAPEHLEGEDLAKSKAIMEKMNALKAEAMPGPFVHLHICFTNPEYRRRGAGGLMLQWGCDLMDLLGLPGWVEASDEGNLLYKAYGFYDFQKLEGESGGTNMKRDPKPSAIEGGRN